MMDVSARYSSSLVAVAVVFAAGCVDELPPLDETTSLRVTISSPADVGTSDDRLDDEARSVTLDISALDEQGELDTEFSGEIDIYAHFLGSLTPALGATPLQTATMTAGVVEDIQVELPVVYGETFLWAEHTTGDAPTFATGTSPSLWYRDPQIADVSRPINEALLGEALSRSPLEEKQVSITGSRYEADGKMIVTGSYAQGYTVSDVDCSSGSCVVGDYDSLFVYTFSRPEEVEGGAIERGHVVTRVSGGISEFNGLTEVNFPKTNISGELSVADIPAPVVLQQAWLTSLIEMEQYESALVAIEGATLCPLDDDYATYSQWKLDLGNGCRDAVNIISQGQVPDFSPTAYVGQIMPRVVGTLRPVNIGTFNVWIVYPRDFDDITLPD